MITPSGTDPNLSPVTEKSRTVAGPVRPRACQSALPCLLRPPPSKTVARVARAGRDRRQSADRECGCRGARGRHPPLFPPPTTALPTWPSRKCSHHSRTNACHALPLTLRWCRKVDSFVPKPSMPAASRMPPITRLHRSKLATGGPVHAEGPRATQGPNQRECGPDERAAILNRPLREGMPKAGALGRVRHLRIKANGDIRRTRSYPSSGLFPVATHGISTGRSTIRDTPNTRSLKCPVVKSAASWWLVIFTTLSSRTPSGAASKIAEIRFRHSSSLSQSVSTLCLPPIAGIMQQSASLPAPVPTSGFSIRCSGISA